MMKQPPSTCVTLLTLTLLLCLAPSNVHGYAFVSRPGTTAAHFGMATTSKVFSSTTTTTTTGLKMMDDTVLQGAGIAVAGLVAGIGLVAFTEQQGERAKERGSGLSDGMSTRIAGQLMEDVEVSSVSDLGGLTAQLEQALKETGQTEEEQFQLTEQEKQKIAEEADDGW
mmetsp:Transcript_19110/g.52420  ORF Transcript_19110/g.52420 Transcript_19110/m.52420 type:complete len:169 (+) Transcript_19110:78-584(+)